MLLSQNRKTEMAENSETGLCMVDNRHCLMLTCAIRIVFREISLCWKEEKLHSGVRLLSAWILKDWWKALVHMGTSKKR